MSETIRAVPAKIELGNLEIDVYQLPDGSYRLSQTQVAEAVGNDEVSFRDFLTSKSPYALPYKGFRSEKIVSIDNNVHMNGIPIKAAAAYWGKEATKKTPNPIAIQLLAACAIEAIETRADKAFGVLREEEYYNFRFKENIEMLKETFPNLQRLMFLASESQFYDDDQYQAAKPLLRADWKYPIPNTLHENDITNRLANFSLHVSDRRWHLQIEDELQFNFDNKKQYSYPDLTTGVFSGVLDSEGTECRVLFIFEVKTPIIEETDIKKCIYDRKYLEAAREKYKTEHVFLFMVAPNGGNPTAYKYIEERLAPDDKPYVKILQVKQLAEFLKQQVTVINKSKRAEITRRFSDLFNYPIQLAPNKD